MKFRTLSLLCLFIVSGCQIIEKPKREAQSLVTPKIWPVTNSRVPLDPEVERFVAELIAQMSLEEKVGQMIQAEINHITPEDIKRYHLGSVLSGGGSFPGNNKHANAEDWVSLADKFYEASVDTSDGNMGIPILWGIDAVHGQNNSFATTIFPHNIGLGATRNPNLVGQIAEITAIEVNATGQDWTFAPAVTVVRDDRWGRSYEGFGETPELVRLYTAPIIEGYQGRYGEESFMDEAHIIATAKVFLGDGGTHLGKDQGNNIASEKVLRDIHAVGFVKAINAGAQTIMAGFNSWQGVKLHGHKGLLTDVLKNQMGFDGFVVSDWNAHAQVPGCTLESCAAAINAGIDVVMVPENWKAFIANTLQQVNDGEIAMERINDAVTRILRVKVRYGLFDKPKPSLRLLAGKQTLLAANKHRDLARQAVRQSLVLLKNNNQLLPIDPRKNILVLGDGANNIGKQCGGWTLSWQGSGNNNEDFPQGDAVYTALLEQIQNAGGHLELLQGEELNYQRTPDVAIMVFGEDPYAEFVGDRNTLIFEERGQKHLKLLHALKQENIPVVSIFISGRPMWVNPYMNLSESFVAAWLPGTEAGGIADVLLTDEKGQIQYDFSGKLSFSWPKFSNQFQLNVDQTPYDPLFAYGYGLTYQDNQPISMLNEEIDEFAKQLAQSMFAYNEGQVYLPWAMYVSGAEVDDAKEVVGYLTESKSKAVSARLVDKNRQGDSMQITWHKNGTAYFEAFEPVEVSQNAVIHMQFRVDEMPKGKVKMKIGCGDNCEMSMNVNSLTGDWQARQWERITVPLSCFEMKGSYDKAIRRISFESDALFAITMHSLSIENQKNSAACDG